MEESNVGKNIPFVLGIVGCILIIAYDMTFRADNLYNTYPFTVFMGWAFGSAGVIFGVLKKYTGSYLPKGKLSDYVEPKTLAEKVYNNG